MTVSLKSLARAFGILTFVIPISATVAIAAIGQSLTTDQAMQIDSGVTPQYRAAQGDAPVLVASCQKSVENSISTFGTEATGSIVSAEISIAEREHLTPQEIGTCLGSAASDLKATNSAAARAIAVALANEGNTQEILAFQTTTTGRGNTDLADVASQGASPTGETGGNVGFSGSTGSGFTGGAGGTGGGGCLNPSCTKL